MSVDHLTPLSKGGTNDDQNLALVHRCCNEEKRNETLEEHWEWRYRRGRDKTVLTSTIVAERIKIGCWL